MMMSQLSNTFRSQDDNELKQHIVNIVNNGPGEQPSSPLIQMLLVRLRRFLKFESILQVSYAEYHSKRNFVERVHAEENKALSRHGPFSSTNVHAKNKTNTKEHQENIEAMAKEVMECIRTASFGEQPISCERGST